MSLFDRVTFPVSLHREPTQKMHQVSYWDSEADASPGNALAAIALGFWSLYFAIFIKDLGILVKIHQDLILLK